ncbi:FAD-binding oxidoreductase [Rhizobium sp. KAs_5_22]|uniref:NAD(P)/FAD-dependent oxidoreductase n=1 Tax=Ciceribacter selenitireducens TaxID=448181 RepID=UPI00048F39A7|nr:FAD-dependent oxidoreductase [Ciceribacter selenitireducens]PPJ45762.1 FAD-binding oxidoreductase [Rhizobium sp. KAs_5_22]
MNRSHFSRPVWRRPDRAPPPDQPIAAPERVDLAVVGGGLQGLSTAYAAACKGMSVRIIEARSLGEGASGLNGGQVIPGLKYDPEWLVQHFGEARGTALVDFAAGTADAVFRLIETEGLDVERVRSGWIHAAHTHTALAAAGERNRQWRARGADVVLLNGAETALLTGATGYLGGWLDRRGGTINPLAFTLELARLATEVGVKIATGVSATRLRREGTNWQVETTAGHAVTARAVVIATNAYSDRLVPGLARSLVPLHSFQVATAPLSEQMQASILPHGQAVSDSRRILVYYRKSPDGRLVLGGRGRMSEPRSEKDWAHLQQAMIRLFPQIEGVAIEHRWFGRVAMTSDHLPHVHEPEKGLLAVAGCQGRGVGLMTALGPRLADYIEHGDPAALPFPVSPIRPIPLHALRQIGVGAMIAWYRMLDGFED